MTDSPSKEIDNKVPNAYSLDTTVEVDDVPGINRAHLIHLVRTTRSTSGLAAPLLNLVSCSGHNTTSTHTRSHV